MARSRALPISEGVVCSVMVNKLSPSRNVAEALPNAAVNQRVKDTTHHAVITRSGRTYDTIYFTLLSLPGVEISATQRYVIVMEPGHTDDMDTFCCSRCTFPHYTKSSAHCCCNPDYWRQNLLGAELRQRYRSCPR